MLISVVIPTLNETARIEACLRQFERQPGQWELIVVDGGSSDDTIQKVRAMGVMGAWKGARELKGLSRIARLPRLLCVQQETCAPMVRAFEAGCETIRPEHIVERPDGIARAILRGDPTRCYPYVRRAVLENGGTFSQVMRQLM